MKLDLNEEESSYSVIKKTIKALKKGEDIDHIISCLESFVKPKDKIMTEMDELTIRARRGDDEAAKELISKLAEMHDGPDNDDVDEARKQ